MKLKQYLPLLLIIVVALMLRLVFLDRIPIGINDDELDYVLNAKAIFLTGKDISGTWNPLSLSTPPNEVPKGELTYLIISPFIGIANLSLFWARFPYVIFNILLITLIYFITKELLGEKEALIACSVAAINPWSIYFSRTSYEAPIAVLFYLSSFYVLLKTKGWKILLALPTLFLGFFTYIGAKIIFLPFLMLSLTYSYLNISKRDLKKYITVFLLSLFVFLFFVVSLPQRSAGTRLGEILTPFHTTIINKVDEERKLSIENPVQNLFSNKLTVYIRSLLIPYFGLFSTDYLFLYGEAKSMFSVWEHGNFYYLDSIFLILGLVSLFSKQKRLWIFLILAIVVSTFPSILSSVEKSYGTRSSLAFPFLFIIIAQGIWYFITLRKSKVYQYASVILLIFVYLLLLSNFFYVYLFRNPAYNSEGFSFSKRALSKYIDLALTSGNPVFVISDAQGLATPIFKNYIFYTNGLDRETSKDIADLLRDKSTKYKNLEIANCPSESLSAQTVVIASPNSECKILEGFQERASIAKLSDGTPIFNIFNDQVCNKYGLNRYPAGITFEDLSVEKQSEKDFCGNFITRPDIR